MRSRASLPPASRRVEQGFTVAEIMVAVIILAIVMTASAWGLAGSFRASSNMENRAKATQLAQDVIAQAQQAPWKQLYIPASARTWSSNINRCGAPGIYQSSTTNFVYVDAPADGTASFPGITGCKEHKFKNGNSAGVGVTFYVSTHVVYIRENQGFDSSPGTANSHGNTNFAPKRVYVHVRWTDIGSSGASDTMSMVYTRVPTPADCMPTRLALASGSTLPDGCIRT